MDCGHEIFGLHDDGGPTDARDTTCQGRSIARVSTRLRVR